MASDDQATDNSQEPLGSIALKYGLFPLATGSLIFGAFFVSEHAIFALAGLGFILIGISFAIFGIYRLSRMALKDAQSTELYSLTTLKVFGCLLLIASNFPVAWAYCDYGTAVLSSVHVYISNESAETIDEMTLRGGGNEMKLGSLMPGKRTNFYFVPRADGELTLSIKHDNTSSECIIVGYITPGMHDQVRVNIFDNLRISAGPFRER
jgi:hypothetical protein